MLEIYIDKILAYNFNWLCDVIDEEIECYAKFRYRQSMQKVVVRKCGKGVEIIPQEKQRSVTPGQFVVLYKQKNGKNICIGGGEISSLSRDGVTLNI